MRQFILKLWSFNFNATIHTEALKLQFQCDNSYWNSEALISMRQFILKLWSFNFNATIHTEAQKLQFQCDNSYWSSEASISMRQFILKLWSFYFNAIIRIEMISIAAKIRIVAANPKCKVPWSFSFLIHTHLSTLETKYNKLKIIRDYY